MCWRSRSAVVACLLLLLGLAGELAAYVPEYGTGSRVSYSAGEFRRFPDVTHIVEQEYRYFLSELNFDDVDNKILTGGADRLYMMSYNLESESVYEWETDSGLLASCPTDNTNFACRNHIRVYKKMPTNESLLFVCGSQAGQDPQCRTIDISGGSLIELGSPTTSDLPTGVVSTFPEYSGFGEFRAENATDMVYFTAGRDTGESISYQEVSLSSTMELTVEQKFRTIEVNRYWLRSPVVFVDYYRADRMTDPTNPLYQYYYVFLRENLHTDVDESVSFDVIYSRVVRICRNDKGSVTGSGGMHHFVTYMKARIFCEIEVPNEREFSGDIKYQYNEIRSMVLNDGGRYYEGGDWLRMMYGAFSGPTLGPAGSAICAYDAENTASDTTVPGVFQNDLILAEEGATDTRQRNFWFNCDPDNDDVRTDELAQDAVVITKDITQLRPNDKIVPLLVLDDIYVTQMALDRRCVVTSSDSSICQNLDVLFLGTDTGKILKMVVGVDASSSEVFPIISEEIELDDDNAVNELKLREIAGTKYLFVTTWSKIYRLPLERCARHESCEDCIGSRDPYCVWNTDNSECELSTLTATDQSSGGGVVANNLKQNVHTGEIPSLCALSPVCELVASALNYTIVQVEVFCNNTDNVMVTIPTLGVTSSSITLFSGTGPYGEDKGSDSYHGSHGLQYHDITVTAIGMGGVEMVDYTTTVTTPAGPPLSLQASEVYADVVTSTSFRVSVSISTFTDDFNNYQFRVRYNAPSLSMEMQTSFQALTTSTSITLTGLSPTETVTYAVDVENSNGTTASQSFTLMLRDGMSGSPLSVDGTGNSTAISFSWDQPSVTNGDIVGYTVQLTSSGDTIRVHCLENLGSSPSGNSYTFEGLIPYTNYTFTAQACNDAGEGAMSTPLTVMTECGVAGQVQNFNFHSITSNTTCYSWDPPTQPNGDPSSISYKVLVDCYDPTTGKQSSSQTVGSRSLCQSGLDPLTSCCVTVSATNNCGTGDIDGLPVQFCGQTTDVAPGVISSLDITTLSPFSLLLVWTPPTNYRRQGLTYTIELQDELRNVENTYTITDVTSYYIDGLTQNTQYYIDIAAHNDVEQGPSLDMPITTLPSNPPPPTDPVLSISPDYMSANLTWELSDASLYSVTGYIVYLRCNEVVYSGENTSETSISLDISDPGADFAWCAAQVQAVNDIGRSDFSVLAQAVVPSRKPSRPRCFLVDDQGSQVTISFDVTHPFSLSDLTVEYNLTSDFDTTTMGSLDFNSSSSNVVYLPVSRNTRYGFTLILCNQQGCSAPCMELSNFTTSSVSPRPPTNITAIEVSWNTATIVWERPLLENESNIVYTVQINSFEAEPILVEGLNERRHVFNDLRPDTEYTLAIRVTDTVRQVVGLYGTTFTFQTSAGIPSIPRNVRLDYSESFRLLEIFWAVPQTTNGTITMYEIHWSGSFGDLRNCENPSEVVFAFNQTGDDIRNFEYKTTNTSNIELPGTILVCVRAYTDEPGPWNYDSKEITRVGEQSGSDDEDCNTVTALAVVAAFIVASTIVLAVLLFFVIHKKYGANFTRRSSSQVESMKADSDSGSTIKCDSNPPTPGTQTMSFDGINSVPSYVSQKSTTPLMPKDSECAGSDSGLSAAETFDNPIWKSPQ